MRIARWIPKAANSHSEYVLFIAFLLQQWLNKCASMLSYTYKASLFPTKRETHSSLGSLSRSSAALCPIYLSYESAVLVRPKAPLPLQASPSSALPLYRIKAWTRDTITDSIFGVLSFESHPP